MVGVEGFGSIEGMDGWMDGWICLFAHYDAWPR